MRDACTSPGSRCTPLVLTLARQPELRCHSHIDERCAGFFALGLAKATGLPVAVTCTSGTAVAQLMGAAIEAREARVPLLLLTADRPAELRDNGAGQAIDQLKLFGAAAKWFVEVSVHDCSPDSLRWMRTLACRAYATALEGRPGVVHLNFPLREPLVLDGDLPHDSSARPGARPFVARRAFPAQDQPGLEELQGLIASARRGVLVAGRHERETPLGRGAADFAAASGWPLLADPMSGARRGEAAIAHYDALLRHEPLAAAFIPDLVLRVGDLPVSKPLRSWLERLGGVRQVSLDPEGAWQDPSSVVTDSMALEPAGALQSLRAGVSEDDWLARWRTADELTAAAIGAALATEGLCEPALAAELGVLLPERSTLFAASSMPIRDIETFWPVRGDPPRVLCNRGANGIDGTVSSAFGAAAASDDPVVLVIGDVALAYDIGGLLASMRLQLRLTIVLINNDGGGIFDFLPVSKTPLARSQLTDTGAAGGELAPHEQDIYTRHIATPTGLDFARAASLYGLRHELVGDLPGLRAALERELASDGSGIVEVRGDRQANVALHRRIWDATAGALSELSLPEERR
jgi:2-succinyl-5-enolpyruvyl-6-hydroxy-3-cyclohexene-1-carboxylate synthase